MFEKKYTLKQFISVTLGVPAGIIAAITVDGEAMWLTAICEAILAAIIIWNYGKELAKDLKETFYE